MHKLKSFNLVLLSSLFINHFNVFNNVNKINTLDSSTEISSYFYDQLVTKQSQNIYKSLLSLGESGAFKTGNTTIDLIKEGYLENKNYVKSELLRDFYAARDAFSFDHPEYFYVDFSKLSLRYLYNNSSYKITLGIGKEDNYFASGFSIDNISTSIEKFSLKVDEIVSKANNQSSLIDKIKTVYTSIISYSTYALEKDAKKENIPYVRNPYGSLVQKESVCEGFARSLKIVLDKLNINNVLVQGFYEYNNQLQSHMWNYVELDDYRYYLLDATMDNGLSEEGNSTSYFLKSSLDEVSSYYQQIGKFSSSSSFEFNYPYLSGVKYNSYSTKFTFTKENDINYVSYDNKGIIENEKEERYLLFTYDTQSLSSFHYVSIFYALSVKGMSKTPYLEDIDEKTRFNSSFIGDYGVVYAVTNIKPKYSFEEIKNASNIDKYTSNYEGDKANIIDISNVTSKPSDITKNPYVVSQSINEPYLKENTTYNAHITFSEDLQKVYSDQNVKVTMKNNLSSIEIEDVDFSYSKPNEISFSFKTTSSYYYNLNYIFTISNLIGKTSRKVPLEIVYSVINNVKFACPNIENSLSEIYVNEPVLISSSDLSKTNWIDKDGKEVSKDIPSRLSLVAYYPSKEENDKMLEEIRKNEEVLSSSTYELQLNLCDRQIEHINGTKIKVLIPYPSSFNPSSTSTTFKAYHFKNDGQVEEIECVTTNKGIIIYCDSFSPFIVIETKKTNSMRKLAINVNGKGSISKEYVLLNKGESTSLDLNINEGYDIDYLTLNDKLFTITNNKINIKYDDLDESNNILEVFITNKKTLQQEKEEGYFTYIDSINTNLNSDPNHIGLYVGLGLSAFLILIVGTTYFVVFSNNKKEI